MGSEFTVESSREGIEGVDSGAFNMPGSPPGLGTASETTVLHQSGPLLQMDICEKRDKCQCRNLRQDVVRAHIVSARASSQIPGKGSSRKKLSGMVPISQAQLLKPGRGNYPREHSLRTRVDANITCIPPE